MSKSTISPFSASVNVPSIISYAPNQVPIFLVTPFSESISMTERLEMGKAYGSPEIKRSFTNLRKAWLDERAALPDGKKSPSEGEIRKAKSVLKKWGSDLKKAGKLDSETARRIQAALKVSFSPKSLKPSAVKLAKAEKVIRVIAKESGKKLASKIVARFALKIVPFLGTALMIKEVVDLARSAPAQKFFRKVTGREGSFAESPGPELKFHPRIPAGSNYHCSVGWY